MTNGATNLSERVQAVEQKLDALASSVDERFDRVDAAIVEQRGYTEFAYETLDSRMTGGFARLDQKMDERFVQVDGRFARLERKIDQIIDLQMPKPPAGGSDEE